MASYMSLPTELRLQVCKHLIKSCLSDGDSTAMRGLLLSCRKIHEEIKDSLTNVQRLIDIMTNWRAAHPDDLPLLFQLPEDYELSNSPTKVTVSIPWSDSWPWRTGDIFYWYIQSYRACVTALIPLTEMPWTEVAMRVYNDSSNCTDQTLAFIMIGVNRVTRGDKQRRHFLEAHRLVCLIQSRDSRTEVEERSRVCGILAYTVDSLLKRNARRQILSHDVGEEGECGMIFEYEG